MSKHPSDNTKRNLLRRGLAGILTLALVLGLLPSTLVTARAASWADPYVQTLVDWGVMRGDVGGNMAPDRSITRAEFVTMMNRAYGYTKLGGNPFTDVRRTDWYYEDIDIAYNIGYFQGTSPTTASPNDSLTREQAAVLLARNMVLQETVGETLGFSDSRTLSDWSRGLVGAAAANGIISGYEDGTFKPMNNITRGEVAAMLVRAIGTPIQTAGDHALGNVYGNVTVNTSGVKLRDGVIAGNLYLTGGIDLGDILLENVTVLGEIIVSGGGESDSAQSSIIMRNVVADNMLVDSISNQFITIRAEGNTDIPTTTVRTSAYVDDSSLPGYGLSFITLDGEEGSLYQLAGNIKEVVNKTPGSDMQFVQGTADKVTVDEYATGSSVLVDGDAVVGELDLDVATDVTGTGDIANLNVGAAGSTVEQLPDSIDIRPGITADIAGSNMNSTQAAESSSAPKLLAGYPAVKSIAPTSATLVFKTNKTGTIYWAVSAIADGSVSEADLLEPPVYGNKVIASGTVTASAANTEYTAAVSRLTSGGSYYVTAMLVDGRDQHSPIKVTSFSTPDNTVPAFATGYPYMSRITCENAQVTVMTTKSCLLYYALLPNGAAAPTPEEFKSAAIPGNLGYGSMSVTKNVTVPFQVNSVPLDEKTTYVLYLWLTDHDGAQSARSVTRLPFTTPDETPPLVTDMQQTNETPTSIQLAYTIDEPASLVWAIVTEGDHMAKRLFPWVDENFDNSDEDKSTLEFADEASLLAAKIRLIAGTGAIAYGSQRAAASGTFNITGLPTTTSSYVLYYIANDNATTSGNLSVEIKALRVHTEDNIPPKASLSFTNKDSTIVTEEPDADADVSIVFSESVKGGTTKGQNIFLNLYNDVQSAYNAIYQNPDSDPTDTDSDAWSNYNSKKAILGSTLSQYITLYKGVSPTGTKVPVVGTKNTDGSTVTADPDSNWIDWRNARVEMPDDGTGNVRIVLPTVTDNDGKPTEESALNLDGGTSYYFHLTGITDLAITNNPLEPYPSPCYLPFSTAFAKINVTETENWEIAIPGLTVDRKRLISFLAEPVGEDKVGEDAYWDMLIWTNTSMNFSLYSRPKGGSNADWEKLGNDTGITVTPGDGYVFAGLYQRIIPTPAGSSPGYQQLMSFTDREYAIYINSLDGVRSSDTWNYPNLQVRISFVAGTRGKLSTPNLSSGTQTNYDTALSSGVSRIEDPSPCYIEKPIQVTDAPSIQNINIDVSDTSATITTTLDKDGYVYYLLLPMSQMYQGSTLLNNTTTRLTDAEVRKVTSFSMLYQPVILTENPDDPDNGMSAVPDKVPLMLGGGADSYTAGLTVSRPTLTEVTDGRQSSSYPQGVMPAANQSPAPGGSEIKIDLTDRLNPNTVYYLFLVTRSATAIYSNDPVCYRFTTEQPIRPTINVRANGTTVNVYVDRTTSLDYWLARNTEEGDDFQKTFADYVDKTVFNDWPTTDTMSGNWSESNTSTGLYTYAVGDYRFTYSQRALKDMTVIDAMATACYNGSIDNDNNYVGSVFDIFASPDAKITYAGIIRSSAISDGQHLFPGEDVFTGPRTQANPISFNDLEAGSYTFVSVGVGAQGQGSGYAFRAYYSVVKTAQTTHPQLVVANPMNGVSTNGVWSGDIQLIFSTQLYYQYDSGSYTRRIPIDTCIMGATGHTTLIDTPANVTSSSYASLGFLTGTNTMENAIPENSVLPVLSNTHPSSTVTTVITLRANGLRYGGGTKTVMFQAGMCNVNGNGAEDHLILYISLQRNQNGVDADGNPVYEYIPVVQVAPDAQSQTWNALNT